MTNQPTEIAIVGGGMVGGALALGLAQHGFSVTVIEHAEPAPFCDITYSFKTVLTDCVKG